jgi:methionyl-tRNA formyltransferase
MKESMLIDPGDTAGTLTEKLSVLGAKLIAAALPLIEAGKLTPLAQDSSRATMAPLLKKEQGLIDWTLSAEEIHNRIRGLSPWPGAYSFLDNKMIKIISSETRPGSGEPGALFERDRNALEAGTGSGLLRIVSIQPEGRKPMSAGEFLRGHRGVAGKKFGKS